MMQILDVSWGSFRSLQFPSILVAAAIVLACVWLLHTLNCSCGKSALPPVHPWALPYLGDGMAIGTTVPVRFFWSRFKKYGPVFRLKVPAQELFVVTEPKLVLQMLKADASSVHIIFPESIKVLAGTIPHMNSHVEHSLWRKGMTKALGPAAIVQMMPELQKIVDRNLDRWVDNPRFSLMNEMMKMGINMGVDVVGGLKLPKDVDEVWAKARVKEYIDSLISLPINFPGTDYHKGLVAKKVLWEKFRETSQREVDKFLAKDPKNHFPNDDESMSMVDAHLASAFNHRPLGAEMLFERILGNYIAAIETTRSAFWVVLTLIAHVPRVMQALREEQNKVVSEHGSAINPTTLQAMPYLEAVVKESLRIMPAFQGGTRTMVQPLEVGGYVLPPGTMLLWSTVLMHTLDPGLWDGSTSHDVPPHMDWENNLEGAFIPERWLPGSKHPKPKNYLGFGTGNHMCVGMVLAYAEVKLVVASVIRRFQYRFLDSRVMRRCRFFPTPKPAAGSDTVEVAPIPSPNTLP